MPTLCRTLTAAAALTAAATSMLWATAAGDTTDDVAAPMPRLERQIRELTLERADKRPASVAHDPVLREIARAHSQAMHDQDVLAHELNGAGPDHRLARQHRSLFGLVSENVAVRKGSPPEEDLAEVLVQGWMDSPGHRRNILAPFEIFEVGCHGQSRVVYCSQLFVDDAARLANDVAYLQPQQIDLPLKLAAGAEAARISIAPTDDATADPGVAWRSGRAVLRLPAAAGSYRLRLWLQQPDDASRYSIIPGPYVCVVADPSRQRPAGLPDDCLPAP